MAFISQGSVCRAVRSAVDMAREQGLPASSVELKTLWPFPDDLVRRALKDVKRVVVVEMNLGRILLEVQRVVRQPGIQIQLFSKVGGVYPNPQEILTFTKE